MATYTVRKAAHKKDVTTAHGEMQVINLALVEEGKDETIIAEWFTKKSTPIPEAGARLEGEIRPGQYGNNFKKAAPQGGFRPGGKSPEERRAIAMQSSGQRGTDIICALITAGAWKPESADDAAQAALKIAERFYDAVMKAESNA